MRHTDPTPAVAHRSPASKGAPLSSHSLRRRVLRALAALCERSARPSIESLLAIVPADVSAIVAALRDLDRDGLVDAGRLRLTMAGFIASRLPVAIAFERRTSRSRAPHDDLAGPRLAKAIRVA